MARTIQVLEDKAAVARAAADRLLDAVRAGGAPQIVVTGGSTPRDMNLLVSKEQDVDWSPVTLWFSDERCVAPDHEYSNYGMTRGTLIDNLPRTNKPRVMRMHGEDGDLAGAGAYEAEVRSALGNTPVFDLVFLGLGPDGHCASLFPSKPEWREQRKLVVGVEESGMPPNVSRISMTLPLLNAARHVVFAVCGKDKQQAVERVFGPLPDLSAPGAHVDAARVTVLLDRAAADHLPEGITR